jgi:hypothetical protein
MTESSVKLGTGAATGPARPDEKSPSGEDEQMVLVAAVVATLVTYQRSLSPPNGNSGPPEKRWNWRMMARWGQLQGYL